MSGEFFLWKMYFRNHFNDQSGKNLTGEFIYGHKCFLNFFKINYKINWHVEIEFCKITDFTLKKTPFENAPS